MKQMLKSLPSTRLTLLVRAALHELGECYDTFAPLVPGFAIPKIPKFFNIAALVWKQFLKFIRDPG